MRLLCEVNGMLFILGKTDSRVSPHWVQKISLLQESQEGDDHQVRCPPGTCSHTVDLHIKSLSLCYPGCVAILLSGDLSVSSAAVTTSQVQQRTESSCYLRYVGIL